MFNCGAAENAVFFSGFFDDASAEEKMLDQKNQAEVKRIKQPVNPKEHAVSAPGLSAVQHDQRKGKVGSKL